MMPSLKQTLKSVLPFFFADFLKSTGSVNVLVIQIVLKTIL